MPPARRTATAPVDDVSALRAEIDALRARVTSLEAERDELAQQNAELFVLQQVLSTLNSTMELDDILGTVLRGILEAMEFRRVVLLDVQDGTATARLEADAHGSVRSLAPHATQLRMTPALHSMLTGHSEFATGASDGPECPVPGPPGAFCMVPLTSRGLVRGVLFVDRDDPAEIGDVHLRMLLDFAAQAAVAMENARLYGETKRLLEKTQQIAATDPLTGLANRRGLETLAERELHNALRYGALMALLVLDVDDLKRINDDGGHRAGDEALVAFADALRSGARRGDLVARYGGDEFVLLMAQCGRSGAETAARRLFVDIAQRGLRCSAGIAVFPQHGNDFGSLFESADRALYEAKSAGKNQFRVAGS